MAKAWKTGGRGTCLDIGVGHAARLPLRAAPARGPGLLVKTIQQNFGIPINHVVMANFPGFEGMVNALGGISLDFPDPVRDLYSGLDVTTVGCQSVNGTTALALVRSRHLYYFESGSWHYDGMSDWSRIQRQQAFFHALLNKANSEFPNLLAINDFLQATANDLKVDSGFSSHEMISLGLKFRGTASSELTTAGTANVLNDHRRQRRPLGRSALRKRDGLQLPRLRCDEHGHEHDRDRQALRDQRPDDYDLRCHHDDHPREPGHLRQPERPARTLEPEALLTGRPAQMVLAAS